MTSDEWNSIYDGLKIVLTSAKLFEMMIISFFSRSLFCRVRMVEMVFQEEMERILHHLRYSEELLKNQ